MSSLAQNWKSPVKSYPPGEVEVFEPRPTPAPTGLFSLNLGFRSGKAVRGAGWPVVLWYQQTRTSVLLLLGDIGG